MLWVHDVFAGKFLKAAECLYKVDLQCMQLHIYTATTLQNTPQTQTLFTASEAPKTRVIVDQVIWHASIEAVCKAYNEKNALDMT